MKDVWVIREILTTDVHGSIYSRPPEEDRRGEDRGVAIWSPREDPLLDHPEYPVDDETDELGPGRDLEEIFEIGADVDEAHLEAAFGGDTGERIRRSIELKGVDALAWYSSFHFTGVQWGIYIPASSLCYLASGVFGELEVDWDTRIRIAFRALHQHELFHFGVDYAVAQLELLWGQVVHRKARKQLRDRDLGYIRMEEALANGQMIRSFQGGSSRIRARGRTDALRAFVLRQGAGYNEGDRFRRLRDFENGWAVHLSSHGGVVAPPSRQNLLEVVSLSALFPGWPRGDWRYCPVHIIPDEGDYGLPSLDLGLFRRIAEIHETRQFSKELRRQSGRVQAAWKAKRQMLAESTEANGLDFKLWQRSSNGNVWSIRLTHGHRAHLRHDRDRGWLAISVGGHSAMGHG